MSQGDRFRTITPILGIACLAGRRVMITIPENAIVEVVTGLMNDDRMIEVWWDGNVLLMFVQDLRERGEPLAGCDENPSSRAKSPTPSCLPPTRSGLIKI
jgi:hypothetical protein